MARRLTNLLLVPTMLWASVAPLTAEAFAQAPPEDAAELAEEPPVDAAVSEQPATTNDNELAPEDPVDQAQRLFTDGAAKFETADYAGAIADWTRAYALVPNVPEYGSVKAKLIANLAAAQERAYAVDHEVAHLEQAKILLESYRGSIDEIYTSADEREQERAWVAERVASIDAELDAVAKREAENREPIAGPTQPERPPGQALIIGGSVAAVLGVAGLGLMVGGMAVGAKNNDIADIPSNDLDARAARFDKGRLGNTLAIAGGVGGAVLLGTGVALIAIGLKHKRAAGSASATLIPVLGGSQAGLALVGKF